MLSGYFDKRLEPRRIVVVAVVLYLDRNPQKKQFST